MNTEPFSMQWPTARIRGQDCFQLSTSTVELAVTVLGGMLGPVKFFPSEEEVIEPYHIAPWAEEAAPAGAPAMLQALRGDWFCSAFGGNAEPVGGSPGSPGEARQLPPHGETANRCWRPFARGRTDAGCWMQLEVELPLQGGSCKATTALLSGQSIVYQRHDLEGLVSPINPGHHATLQFPATPGAGHLSFSPLRHAQSYLSAIDGKNGGGSSCLVPNTVITDLHAAPVIGGLQTDLCRFPARSGFDDIVILCADLSLDMAWVAVTFPEQRYVWFALRNPSQLASTLLWFSNGGRADPPWNGRHVNVMGVEDITAFFHDGIAASCRPNALTERGIPTCLTPGAGGRLSIPYIQGVARIPPGFERVAAIDPGDEVIHLRSPSGRPVSVLCHLDFLRTGMLPGLEFS